MKTKVSSTPRKLCSNWLETLNEVSLAKKRKLFLDIDGHRNSSEGFDADMLELQKDFLLEFLGRYLTEIHAPLINLRNEKPQRNDLPPDLIVQDG